MARRSRRRFLTKLLPVGGVFVSAYHWTMSLAPTGDATRYFLYGTVGVIAGLAVLLSTFVGMQQVKGRNRTITQDSQ